MTVILDVRWGRRMELDSSLLFINYAVSLSKSYPSADKTSFLNDVYVTSPTHDVEILDDD